MLQLSRRQMLKKAMSITGLAWIPGCSKNREAKIADLAVINLDNKAHNVTILVFRDEKKVYERAFHVEPSSEFGTEENPAPLLTEEWMNKPGTYTIQCSLDSSDNITKRQFPSENRDGTCFSVVVKVTQDAILTVPSTTTDSCE